MAIRGSNIRRAKLSGLSAAVLSLLATMSSSNAAAQDAAIFLVGTDPACDFSTVQAAINAAAAHLGPDAVHVARNATYSQQAIRIGSQDLDLVGGFDDCTQALNGTPSGTTTLSGSGGAGDSVITITGGGRRVLSHLNITGGDDTEGGGGGVDYSGSGAVEISDTVVGGNRAEIGGGIRAESANGSAVLELKHNVVVVNNTADANGGGVHISGNTTLYMVHPQSILTSNHAPTGFGGGLYVRTPAVALIGSPGYGAQGAIDGNDARNGGGIAVVGGGAEDTDYANSLVVFATDSSHPPRIEHNFASERGGALYMKGYGYLVTGDRPEAYLSDAVVIDNRAVDGAAFYLDYDTTSLPPSEPVGATLVAELKRTPGLFGSVPCTDPSACNRIERNIASGTNGAILRASSDSFLRVSSATLAGNEAAHLSRIIKDDDWSSSMNFEDSLLAYNMTSGTLIDSGNASTVVNGCTIASNLIDASFVLGDDGGSITLFRSIIDQPNELTIDHSAGTNSTELRTGFNISRDVTTLSASDASSIVASPRFYDPEVGNFGLQAGSPAVDFAAADGNAPFDRYRASRDRNMPVRPDRAGPRDIGAFELQAIDNLVRNTDFVGNLRLWQNLTPAFTSWSTQDAGSSASSGSVEINVPAPTTLQTVTAMSQCIHVPGPGVYRLGGAAFAGNALPVRLDRPFVRWAYRKNGDECQGPITSQGQIYSAGGTGWLSPAPTNILVPVADWNMDSSIELQLGVERNPNDPQNSGIFGRFDDIALRQGSDSIFANGFDREL
jgi:hypothetical protein